MKTRHPNINGIDTHKSTHVPVAIDTQGTRLAALSIPTNAKGYLELERWSETLGKVCAFGIEGTGSYGAGLSRSLFAKGQNVIEVTRLVTERAPDLMASHGIAALTIADGVEFGWRRSHAHSIRVGFCKTLWCLPNSCIQRQNRSVQIEPGWQQTGQHSALPLRYRQNAQP